MIGNFKLWLAEQEYVSFLTQFFTKLNEATYDFSPGTDEAITELLQGPNRAFPAVHNNWTQIIRSVAQQVTKFSGGDGKIDDVLQDVIGDITSDALREKAIVTSIENIHKSASDFVSRQQPELTGPALEAAVAERSKLELTKLIRKIAWDRAKNSLSKMTQNAHRSGINRMSIDNPDSQAQHIAGEEDAPDTRSQIEEFQNLIKKELETYLRYEKSLMKKNDLKLAIEILPYRNVGLVQKELLEKMREKGINTSLSKVARAIVEIDKARLEIAEEHFADMPTFIRKWQQELDQSKKAAEKIEAEETAAAVGA